MARARPLLERPNDRTAYDCAVGEHEKCAGHHWGIQNGKAVPAWDAVTGKVIACTCGCHVEPWPFEAADYTPPEEP